MRGVTITKAILQFLAEEGEATIASFFPKNHPGTILWRKLTEIHSWQDLRQETLSALLCRLRSQGLVVRSGGKKFGHWGVTSKGRKLIGNSAVPSAAAADGIGRLVIFDIPEGERKKRDAIREELISAGFSQLQKSVWFGERPLPKDFIDFLQQIRAEQYVHIFSVRERGTLPKR